MSEINAEIIQNTQKCLGKYVKKPPLTEKLLRKPPFRFLHDIIKSVIKETGYLKGVFTEEELNSEKVKEKEAKIAFLVKLIDAVKTTGTNLTVRPNKIVAGLEPDKTNILLQTIAKAIDSKTDTTDYAKQLKKSHKDETVKEKPKSLPPKNEGRLSKPADQKKSTKHAKTPDMDPPKSTDRNKSNDRTEKQQKRNREGKQESKKESTKKKESKDQNKTIDTKEMKKQSPRQPKEDKVNDLTKPTDQQNKTAEPEVPSNIAISDNEQLNNLQEDTYLKNKQDEQNRQTADKELQGPVMVRPKSAKPKSSEKTHHDENAKILEAPIPAARPKSSLLRPPSVRPSSARPGAPRLRSDTVLLASGEPVPMGSINVIVENFDNAADEDDEDTMVVVQDAPADTPPEDDGLVGGKQLVGGDENKGQLVEQILEQLQEAEDGSRKKVDIEWDESGSKDKEAITKEVSQLRDTIQTLTKSANPLGKLTNYLHEDLDAMHNELQMWISTQKELFAEVEKQKRKKVESSKPLLTQLEGIEQEIKRVEVDIQVSRNNIIKNENKIKTLLQIK